MVEASPTGQGPSLSPSPSRTSFRPNTELTVPIIRKGGEAENGERYQPRVPRLAMKSRPGSGLPHSRGKHTGDGPGFKIIDMKLINDERQYRANIRSVGVIDGIHQKNHRQNHETIFRFPASVQTSVSIRDIGFPRFIPHPLRCKLPLGSPRFTIHTGARDKCFSPAKQVVRCFIIAMQAHRSLLSGL